MRAKESDDAEGFPLNRACEDPFRPTASDKWAARFHGVELRCRRRPWSMPLAGVSWAGFMTTLIVSNPGLRRRDIGRSLARFWWWQLWRRTVRRPVVLHTAHDCSMVVPPWSKLGGLTVAVGMHEPREELFVAGFVRPGDVVVDVGANLGFYTAIASTRGANVFAFEPSTQARLALETNVGINRGGMVEIFPCALGDEPGRLNLTLGLDVTNHLVETPTRGQELEPVDVVPLDQLTAGPRPRIPGPVALLKIDAEGFDEKVLRGAEETILRDRPVVIVETWGDEIIRSWLEERGFSVYFHRFETRELLEYPRPWNRQANLIAVHQEALPMVRERLETAGDARLGLPDLVWSQGAQHGVSS